MRAQHPHIAHARFYCRHMLSHAAGGGLGGAIWCSVSPDARRSSIPITGKSMRQHKQLQHSMRGKRLSKLLSSMAGGGGGSVLAAGESVLVVAEPAVSWRSCTTATLESMIGGSAAPVL